MPFKSEKQRKWMWANDPEMAEKWEKEEKSESRNMRVTENNLRSIIRRTLLTEQSVSGAIQMLLDTLDDNQKAELAASMGDSSKPTGTSGASSTESVEDDGEALPLPEMGEMLDDPENQDAAIDAISQDPTAMSDMAEDNPEAIEDAVDKNPSMLQGFLEDPSIMSKLEDMLKGSDFLKGLLGNIAGSGATEEVSAAAAKLGENTVRLTRRQLRRIIRESFDVINADTGEMSEFAPSAKAALNIFKRLDITPEDMDFMEDAMLSDEDWGKYVDETEGKSHKRHSAKEKERLNIDNLLARVDKWAADAGADYFADNPGMDMQDVGLDLAMNAKYEFQPDEWEALVWEFDKDLGDAPSGQGEWELYDHIANMMVQ